MNASLINIQEQAKTCEDSSVFWDVCTTRLSELGVESLCYTFAPLLHDVFSNGISKACFSKSTHPAEWLEAVGGENFLNNDFCASFVALKNREIKWHEQHLWDDADTQQKQQDEIDLDYGLGIGISYGVRERASYIGFGLNTPDIAQSDFDRFWHEKGGEIRQITSLLDQGIRESYPYQLVKLAPREIDVLTYFSVGLRREAVAEKLGLSVKTIDTYTENAGKKLKSNSRDHMIAKALLLGLINP